MAKGPTPLPIKIVSTILYRAPANIATIAGADSFNKSFPIGVSAKNALFFNMVLL
jgi:hypothetical protein